MNKMLITMLKTMLTNWLRNIKTYMQNVETMCVSAHDVLITCNVDVENMLINIGWQ